MVSNDLTDQFRATLKTTQQSLPPSRSKSPFRSASPGRRRDGKAANSHTEETAFLKEAYRIHTHLTSLSTLLSAIRKPYLSTAPAPSRRHERPIDSRGSNGGDAVEGENGRDGLDRWRDSKYLSDRERDEIDLRGRVILRRCRERVAELEQLEKARQKAVNPPAVSALYTFLPSLAPTASSSSGSQSSTSSLITAHRSSVLWTLNDLLARLVGTMANLQEERQKRREERSRTLGGMASREAAQFRPTSTSTSPFGASSLFSLPGSSNEKTKQIIPPDPPIESTLTQAQLQQFESENNALLDQMESRLTSVLHAENSLMEISAMQTELVRHLASQTEMTERLYDEAVGSVADVGSANTQLKQAKKRGEEGRLFLLVFLVGASLALLFLDWYA